MMGIMVPETCWASNKFCNKKKSSVASSWRFISTYKRRCTVKTTLNEEILLRANEQSNVLHEISKRKAYLLGHILRGNCLLQRVIERKIKGGIEVTEIRGRRRRKLLDNLTERRGNSHLKDETLDRTMWRADFGRGFGPVVRQNTECNEIKFKG